MDIEGMKMEAIIGSKLAVVTGWGTGLAILFVLFREKANLVADALRVVDVLLALSVSTLTLLVFAAVSVAISDLSETSKKRVLDAPSGKIQGWLFSMVLLLCGLLILDAAPEVHGAVRTATALGASVAGSGAVVLYIAVIKLMKRKKR